MIAGAAQNGSKRVAAVGGAIDAESIRYRINIAVGRADDNLRIKVESTVKKRCVLPRLKCRREKEPGFPVVC